MPVFTAPEFSWRATVSLALPLFVVTMASQNLPGVAAIRAAGYDVPISKLIALTGVATLRARAVRRVRAQPGGDHRGDLHGPRGAPRSRTGATSRPRPAA